MRRVVVTGLGLVTPLGLGESTPPSTLSSSLTNSGVRRTWSRLIDGQCGIVSIKDRSPEFALLPSQVAALVPEGSKDEGKWNPKDHLSPSVSWPLSCGGHGC
jgi:3-oxoacyl-[acyl-carrier-protein] synthase II